MKKHSRGNVFLKYIVLFFIITIAIYFPYISNQKSLIGIYDGLSQHYVALGNIKEFIMNILKGNSLEIWDWSIGIGADKVQSYSYYGIGDIFSYIALFFNNMEVAFNVMMLSKVFFAGLGMLIFLKFRLSN
ncbi:YfhO family protein [Vagococcus lutrae]|uniref:YfhO family protein n=1 Tax=Vagococcus lutrae TaxID=81947 RepID=UPI0028A2587C|nr:YfhO family protein [Vagococcus lutrae]